MMRRFLACALLAPALVLADAPRADACGGCFHGPPTPTETETVITDHRMVFSISTTQTVLWDQIRYTGNPAEFAWVLPVQPGATIQLASDAWISALDATTAPVVTGPTPNCGTQGGQSPGVGCGSSSNAGAEDLAPGATNGADSGVTVVSNTVVGPYDAVTVRASAGDSLEAWLTSNGFLIPDALTPTLSAYAAGGFDFIALKLRPDASVNAMQPVRVVSQGADTSLPLRMVAAGVGAQVGITLYVISEGRYHPQNFPDATIDYTKLTWDGAANQSNYETLAQAAMTAGDSRGWITEAARHLLATPGDEGSSFSNPSFTAAYAEACAAASLLATVSSCDAGADDAGYCPVFNACDDWTVASQGMNPADVWVTRLRANLPAQALAPSDLSVEAAPSQTVMPSAHTTETYSDPGFNPCPPGTTNLAGTTSSTNSGGSCHVGTGSQGTVLLVGLGITGILAGARRLRKKR